jgi:hypothetical protein
MSLYTVDDAHPVRSMFVRHMTGQYLRKHGLPWGWALAYRELYVDRYVVVVEPLAGLLRFWNRIGGRYCILAFLYLLGFVDTSKGEVYSLRDWTWNPVATHRRRYAAWGYRAGRRAYLRYWLTWYWQ